MPRPPHCSGKLLVRLEPADVAMFRFLLEARENLAYFTVLERRAALLKIVFAPQSRAAVTRALDEIGQSLPLRWAEWPLQE